MRLRRKLQAWTSTTRRPRTWPSIKACAEAITSLRPIWWVKDANLPMSKSLAKRAQAFGMRVLAYDPYLAPSRAKAMQVLRSRLYDIERQKVDSERSANRKSQVGSGDRSERIRTYNFPQGRVTDHRINLTLYKLDRMIEGDLDEMLDALISDYQAGQLAQLGENQ